MKMSRVLHILPSLDPKAGGVSQAVRNMIAYSGGKDISHEALSLDPADDSYLKEIDFRVHALGRGKTAWNYHPTLKGWLKQHVSSYTHVFVHGLWQYQSLAVLLQGRQLRRNKTKLYVMPHGMLDPYFQKATGRKLKAVRNHFFWAVIEKHLVNRADALLFTCETERKLAGENFPGYRPREEQVIGLGITAPPEFRLQMQDEFYIACSNLAQREYLLFLGRIDGKKGTDLLIKAYLRLKATIPAMPVLVIAGPGEETDYGREMTALAGKNEDIIFTGMLIGAAKWGAFYGCQAFVLPSHQENFGVAVVEALACRKPVLISNQVNIYAEIIAAEAGMTAGDTEEETYLMLKNWLLLTQHKKEHYNANARLCFEKYYTEEVAAQKLLPLIKVN